MADVSTQRNYENFRNFEFRENLFESTFLFSPFCFQLISMGFEYAIHFKLVRSAQTVRYHSNALPPMKLICENIYQSTIAYVDRRWHIEWWIIIVSHVHCHNRDSWLKHINSTFRFAFWNILECGIELGAAVMPCYWRMCREGRGVWGMASRLRTWMAVSILASSSSSFCSHLRITLFNSKWQIDINSCDLTKYLFFGPKKDMIQHFFPKIHSTHSTQLDSLTVASHTGH